MSAYEYKVVPFTGSVKSSSSTGEVSSQLESLIEREATNGWEFCQLNNVNVEVKPGCLGSLLGGQVTYQQIDQVIFRREK